MNLIMELGIYLGSYQVVFSKSTDFRNYVKQCKSCYVFYPTVSSWMYSVINSLIFLTLQIVIPNTLLCISDIIHGLNYVEMPGVADQAKRDAERGVCNWSDNPRLVTRFLK